MCCRKENVFESTGEWRVEQENVRKDQAMTNQTSTYVFLQTVNFNVKGQFGSKALCDDKNKIYRAGTSAGDPKEQKKFLFGGTEIEQVHRGYDVTAFYGRYSKTFEVLDQTQICYEVSPVFYGPWMERITSTERRDFRLQKSGSYSNTVGCRGDSIIVHRK
ncbi:hypothetical protein NQ317_004872 [Molorchus minor]|uniref:Uncharacterized protein n=1 Tax=Molorchus minor TaxID=1323400 RepID=A0ABQ9IQT5_9CUCU|nr:hypothetical protein NQ317_004872 [Molorchus minor]